MTSVGLIHVNYQVRGGEDVHVDQLQKIYESLEYGVSRPSAKELGSAPASALTLGRRSSWSAWRKQAKPDFLHLHNIHPHLGPAFLRWIIDEKIPTIATIHNHRFYCTNGLALYGEEICKACRPSKLLWRPLLKNCNGSWSRTLYHSLSLSEIRSQDLLNQAVTRFLAPSPYMAAEMERAGLAADKIRLVPHVVEGIPNTSSEKEYDFVFAGRISSEKGVIELMKAAKEMPGRSFVLAGSGPLLSELQAKAPGNVKILPDLSREDSLKVIARSRVACAPSLCEESFSLFSAESLLLGLRLVVANNASMEWLTHSPFHALPATVRDLQNLVATLEQALAVLGNQETAGAVKEYFSRDTFTTRLRSVIHEALAAKGGPS